MSFRRILSPLFFAAVVSCAASREEREVADSSSAEQVEANPVVVLETSQGEIVLELFPSEASESVNNFLRYVRGGFYNGLIFHRVIPDFMIQAGTLTANMETRTANLFPVPNEAQNGLKNVRGALAMARSGDPHSATSEFFINHDDNPELDFTAPTPTGWGYTVFGAVVGGIEVVDAIATAPTTRRGRRADFPVDPVVINRAYVR